MTARGILRIAGVSLSLALCAWALFLPAYVTPIEQDYSPSLPPDQILVSSGWEMALVGWTDLPFAWLANIFLLVALLRLSARKLMSLRGAFLVLLLLGVGFLLARSGLTPSHWYFQDNHGVNGYSHPLKGAQVWLGAFVPPMVPAVVDFLDCLARAVRDANRDWPTARK